MEGFRRSTSVRRPLDELAPPIIDSAPPAARARALHLTTADAIARYLVHLEAANAALNTRKAYGRDLGYLRSWLVEHAPTAAADVRALKLPELRAWLADFTLTRKTSSVARAVHAVRSWMRWLKKLGYVADAPADLLANPKVRRGLPRFLSPPAAKALVEAPAADGARTFALARDAAVLELFYSSGLRVSELAGLDLVDVEWTRREVLVTGKGSRERVVPFGGPCAEALSAWLSVRASVAKLARYDPDALFLSRWGCRLTTRTLQRVVKRWGRRRRGGPPSARAEAHVRDALPRGRRRPSRDPGDARALVALDDGALHARVDRPPRSRAPQGAPARARAPARLPLARRRGVAVAKRPGNICELF
jgi:integrase/recombinase XerC